MSEPACLGGYVQLNPPDKLAAAITQALAAFITFENRRNQRINLFESFLYKPLIDIAGGRGWDVSHEYKIKSKFENLEGKEIDFVLKNNSHVCSIEVKYFRSSSCAKTSLSNIAIDIAKLGYFDKKRMRQLSSAGGYLVMVGKRSVLQSAFSVKPRDSLRQLLYEKARFLLENGRQDIFYDWGWRSDEIGEDISKNSVLTLRIKNEIYLK